MTKIGEWKNYFRTSALREGYNLYINNQVGNFREVDENRFIAEVLDRGIRRRVVITKVGNRILGQCNCYEGGRGYFCRHMSAALYYNENHGSDGNDILFDPKEHEEYYFNLAKMTEKIRISPAVIRRARQLVESNKIQLQNVQLAYRTSYRGDVLQGTATAYLYGNDIRPLKVSVQFTKDAIEMSDCNICHNFYYGSIYSGRELCEHQVALLILLDEYIKKVNPGDETSLSGVRLLSSFAGMQAIKKIDENSNRAKIISLDPRLEVKGLSLNLSFRIGVSKMYVLKNMKELQETKEEFGVMKLGKGNELHFATEDFNESSEPYYRYLCDRLKEDTLFRERVLRQYGDIPVRGGVSYIEMRGVALDDFYDLAYGKTIAFDDKNGDLEYSTIKVGTVPYHFSIKVQKIESNDRFAGVSITGQLPVQFTGTKGIYFIRNQILSRMSDEERQFAEPFLHASDGNEIRMKIGTGHLSEFYYRVLPVLKESPLITVEEDEAILQYLPPEAHFDLYLDIENDFVICSGKVTYDENVIDLKKLTSADYPLAKWRDASQEAKVIERVSSIFPEYDGIRQYFYDRMDDEKVYELLDSGVRQLMEIGDVHGSEAFNRLKIRRTPVINVGVSLSSNLLDLEITTQQMSDEELLEVLESYRRKKKFHRLRNGEFISFEQNESLEMITGLMESMNVSLDEFVKGKLHLPMYRALYVNKMLEEHDSIAAERDRHFRNLIRNFNAVKDSEYDVPQEMKSVLRNYQEYGYKWLRTLSDLGFGGILADDMGLGKTIQMIAYLKGRKDAGETKPSLIVCPASVVYNWAEEFNRFAPDLKVIPLAGTAAARTKMLDEDCDVFVTSYDLLKRDIGKYKGHSFACEVLDEGQFIKNPKAAVSKSVKIIEADHRFVLTGTPIENRLSELWSIFDYLMPGFLYTYDRFRTDFETPISKNKDELVTSRLRKMVSPFILRRLKQDVLKDLPEKMEEVRYARFDDTQQKVYDGQVVRMKNLISTSGDDGQSRIKILAELTRIRQICCDPSLILENYEGESAKKDACIQLIESAIDGGHKMLVFSQFTSMLEILRKELDERKIEYYEITGATPKEERMRLVHRFNENEIPVFLISLKAGGTGLNLTGADVVIHYDPWWNLAAQNQATDRAHRIGQKSTVTVYRIIAKDTIEEKILELQEAKKDLSDAILSGESSSLAGLSKDELLELLS